MPEPSFSRFTNEDAPQFREWNTRVAIVKGGGDLGSGVAIRLALYGLRVLVTELPQPLAVRRAVALAAAVYADTITVEGAYTGRKVQDLDDIQAAWEAGEIPVLVDPLTRIAGQVHPYVVVDAVVAKRNTGTTIRDAPVVIALGPGFNAGVDCHAVIETQRGPLLGVPLYSGQAAPDSGTPGLVGGETSRRVLRAPVDGRFVPRAAIGEFVQAGQVVAEVHKRPVRAEISGVVRGMLADGIIIRAGVKVGDIDPRGEKDLCYLVSDKAWKVAEGVWEAILQVESMIQKKNEQYI